MKENLRKEIVEVFTETNDVQKTADEMNLDMAVVRYHLTKAGIELPKGAWKKTTGGRPISQQHYAVGAKIAFLRHDGGIVKPSEFAEEVGISTKKYTGIEKGTVDATLTDLLRIARAFGKPLHELLEPMNLVK